MTLWQVTGELGPGLGGTETQSLKPPPFPAARPGLFQQSLQRWKGLLTAEVQSTMSMSQKNKSAFFSYHWTLQQ